MKLRQKTLLLVVFPLVGLIALLYYSLAAVLQRSYEQLEEQDTQRNVHRVQEALKGDLEALKRVTHDYAFWDDTYTFIADGNQSYINSNLTTDIFSTTDANFIIYINRQGKVIFSEGFNVQQEETIAIPPSLLDQLKPGSPLRKISSTGVSAGLLPTGDEILLVASQPILRTDGSGPSRGTLIMARYLDATRLDALKQRTQLDLSIHLVKRPDLSPDLRTAIDKLEQNASQLSNLFNQAPIHIHPLDADTIEGYTLLSDLYNKPVLLIRVSLPRDIFKQGQVSLQYLILSLLGLGTVFIIILVLLLENIVLKRLIQLSGEVKQIGQQNDLSYRVTAQGKDELSALGQAVNWMLEQLEIKASALAEEQQKAENLLLNILPAPIVPKLKQSQDSIAEHYDEVTILFADIVGFTPLSSRLEPIELVSILNQIFSEFDNLADQLRLEKIKTIGDAYMVAAGLPLPRRDHAAAIAEMALSMQEVIQKFSTSYGDRFQIRVGINTGVAVAGVIGTKKFIYDLWGDAVNIASRMESSGEPGAIQVTEATYHHIKDRFILERRGTVNVKGRGEMTTYWLRGRKANRSSILPLNHPTHLDFILHFRSDRKTLTTSKIPLNLALVLDCSGSMGGQPLNCEIAAAQTLVSSLGPEDFLSVVTFDDIAKTIVPPQAVRDIQAIQDQIGHIGLGGLANLSEGWLMGADCIELNQSQDALNRILLFTSGKANLGVTDAQALIQTAKNLAERGIVTTTLGFGHRFNEELLIEIANASGGNFYLIQSPEEIQEVVRIELEGLVSLVTQDLIATIRPISPILTGSAEQNGSGQAVEIVQILNNYRTEWEGENLKVLRVFMGDVYAVEPKPLTIELSLPAFSTPGIQKVATVSYQYRTLEQGTVHLKTGEIPLTVEVGSPEQATQMQPDQVVQEQASKLRIAKAKEEAVALADRRDYAGACQILRDTIAQIDPHMLNDSFEVAEEAEQLKYYALQLENNQLDETVRKEMRHQSYQARSRSRRDLNLWGTTSGSTESLEIVTTPEGGVLVKCFRKAGKLHMRVISEGYNPDFNVLFPRHLREEGATYWVEDIQLADSGTFYRVCGEIKLYSPSGRRPKRLFAKVAVPASLLQAAKVNGSIQDLETTDRVEDGVLIQCIANGKELRARVVSDGYNPDFDVRLPRHLRQEGMLFVVDGVKETGRGARSYIACGKVRRLVHKK
jgi:sensor domain CHASE-containing protein/class 3 adenylate cyclase